MYLFIIFAPLLSGLLPIINGSVLGIRNLPKVILCFLGMQVILTWYLLYEVVIENSTCTIHLFEWVHIDYFSLGFEFVYDTTSVLMLLLVNTVAFLVHIYSLSYMSSDPGKVKFFSYISFFTMFMNILVTSNNLIQLFIGWEGVGLMSYLLINFWSTRIQANTSGIKAMLVNKIGDVSFLFSIAIILYVYGTVDIYELYLLSDLIYIDIYRIVVNTFVAYNVNYMIAFFFFIAAIGKSAQLGLHIWLPDAMEGPTPVSALIHAATMVTAGIFLIIRTNFFFDTSILLMSIIIVIGTITSLFSATVALLQTDIKKIIAYSTCSQLGLMLVACGFHQYYLSLFHMINHGFFKALLFLSAGGIIHDTYNQQDTDEHVGSWILSPFTNTVSLIASLSLTGIYFGSGFYSKELIVSLGNTYYTLNVQAISVLLGISTCITTIYSWQIINDIINTNKNIHFVDASKDLVYSMNTLNRNTFFLTKLSSISYHIHNTINKFNVTTIFSNVADNVYMNSVYTFLVILSIFSGFVLSEIFYGFGYFIGNYNLDTNPYLFLIFDLETVQFSNQALTCTYAIVGWIFGYLTFMKKPNRLFIDHILILWIQKFSIQAFSFLGSKWFFDTIINRFIIANTWYFNYNIILKIIDYIITEYLASIYLSNVTKQYNSVIKFIQYVSFKSNFYLFFCCIAIYYTYFIL